MKNPLALYLAAALVISAGLNVYQWQQNFKIQTALTFDENEIAKANVEINKFNEAVEQNNEARQNQLIAKSKAMAQQREFDQQMADLNQRATLRQQSIQQPYSVSANSSAENFAPLPIVVGKRKALTGAGEVLIFKNTGWQLLTIDVHCEGSIGARNFRLDVPPNRVSELGYLQGWPLASGDRVTVSANGYATKTYTVN